MVIATVKIIISTEECFSLKEKRKVLLSIKERVKKKFNVSIAEVEYQNQHKQGMLGLAIVSNEVQYANKIISKVIEFIEKYYPGRIIDYEMDIGLG